MNQFSRSLWMQFANLSLTIYDCSKLVVVFSELGPKQLALLIDLLALTHADFRPLWVSELLERPHQKKERPLTIKEVGWKASQSS